MWFFDVACFNLFDSKGIPPREELLAGDTYKTLDVFVHVINTG